MENQTRDLRHSAETSQLIQVFTRQSLPKARQLGARKPGELSKILRADLEAAGFQVYQPVHIKMVDDGKPIGTLRLDLIVNRRYGVVVKHMRGLPGQGLERLAGALRNQKLEIGFLFNFGYARKIIHRVEVDEI